MHGALNHKIVLFFKSQPFNTKTLLYTAGHRCEEQAHYMEPPHLQRSNVPGQATLVRLIGEWREEEPGVGLRIDALDWLLFAIQHLRLCPSTKQWRQVEPVQQLLTSRVP